MRYLFSWHSFWYSYSKRVFSPCFFLLPSLFIKSFNIFLINIFIVFLFLVLYYFRKKSYNMAAYLFYFEILLLLLFFSVVFFYFFPPRIFGNSVTYWKAWRITWLKPLKSSSAKRFPRKKKRKKRGCNLLYEKTQPISTPRLDFQTPKHILMFL